MIDKILPGSFVLCMHSSSQQSTDTIVTPSTSGIHKLDWRKSDTFVQSNERMLSLVTSFSVPGCTFTYLYIHFIYYIEIVYSSVHGEEEKALLGPTYSWSYCTVCSKIVGLVMLVINK